MQNIVLVSALLAQQFALYCSLTSHPLHPLTTTSFQADKEELSSTIDALKSDLSKNDGVFKRTLESDRSKMKQELLNRTQRIRALGELCVLFWYCLL